jgi:hypothetical protein
MAMLRDHIDRQARPQRQQANLAARRQADLQRRQVRKAY